MADIKEEAGHAMHTDNGDDVVSKVAGNDAQLVEDAKYATENEQNMTFKQAVKLYPKAIAWSIMLSTAVVMEGYDVVLLASFYALPQFNRKYGELLPDGTYGLTAAWQSGLSNGAYIGGMIGLLLNGIISERFGYRMTVIASLTAMIGFIFIPFFAPNIQTLLAGEILMGIPWGVFQTITTAYASEVCPVALRGYLTTYVNFCWGVGQIIAVGVLRGLLSRDDEWAYRIPFALQWMWPFPILIGVIFAPESPWWLVRRGRNEDAKKSLLRLTSKTNEDFNADQTLAMMIHTNELEKSLTAGTSYMHCFKGTNLRRTEITCVVWMIQNLCGAAFMGYSVYFFKQAGISTEDAFSLSTSLYGVAMIGVILSWFIMSRFGRRTMYLSGLSAMFVVLVTIGCVSVPAQSTATSWAIGSLLLVYTLVYDITVGTVAFSIVAETPSTRLRTKTIALARTLYNVVGLVNGIITPYMLNPTAWNWKGKSGFFWAGSCLLCLTWTYFRLPEPKGRTYGEMDMLFERGISARKFKETKADVFGPEVHEKEPNVTTQVDHTEKIY